MKRLERLFVLSTASAVLLSGMAVAQPPHRDDHHNDNHHYVRHSEWKKGYHMQRGDWARGERIDYHRYHLRTPPRGYEWREVDGNFVLAAVATGVIASVIADAAASH